MNKTAIVFMLLVGCYAPPCDAPSSDVLACDSWGHGVFEATREDADQRMHCTIEGHGVDSTCHLVNGRSEQSWTDCYERLTLASTCADLAAVVAECEHD